MRVIQLYRRHRAAAYGLACSVLHDEDEALDAVQEAFVRVVRHVDMLQGMVNPYPWLRRIVINVCIDRLRRRRAARDVSADLTWCQEPAPLDFEPSRALAALQLRTAIAEGIERLSEEHREVIVMRELEGMSYDLIATECGCPRGTVMSRLFYARRRLRQLLGPQVQWEPTTACGAVVHPGPAAR